MGAQLRVYRRRIKSVQATKKITKAMELIASARIVKAQNRLQASMPYLTQLVDAVSAAASHASDVSKHPLTAKTENQVRAAVLVITGDRGLAGAYSSNAIKEAEALTRNLADKGMSVVPYVVGRKGVSFYRFRNRAMGGEYVGFTDQPTYAHAKEIGEDLLKAFMTPSAEGGVDEIHVVYTNFINMGSQEARVRRILPLEVVDEVIETSETGNNNPFPLYEFEPGPEEVLDALLPRYVDQMVYLSLLNSAASEHAARRRAMKSATDNAEELIRSLTRAANAARQAEITQEISEIVGGADALSA
ncbi:MAG: F0F1 ATP synthase subunit gamma [Candidatus Nanopelagicales bacterium]|nr:F0F1 ATP synthase subunit gamma [Candidatus Nanopelagicales bacterium]MCF8539441.1 F0F1 ATP synthase subunit gamma [Candidatus Nanopelagicales bacterium]MCF8550606.1 F0F1 ATP synthase subunit gamma [Candidatus Nanopelagicales bacterium]